LKGHERSITYLKYNREGDLIFTTSKHPSFAVWYTENGERLGTYEGHTGAVWTVDVDRHTERIITGSGDNACKLWSASAGKCISTWQHKAPVRSVCFDGLLDKRIVTVTDQVLGFKPTILIWDTMQNTSKPVMEITGKNDAKILQALWCPLKEHILTANEDGTIRVFDIKTGEQTHQISDHTKSVMHISMSRDSFFFITASKDGTSRLYDAKSFKLLKTYTTGRPINAADMSPIKEEVLVGGGQSAESVTTTRVDNTQFKVRFFHMIYEEELGSLQGHFGPVNVLSYSPDGTGFASGGEDGYVRLHHFDPQYFDFGKED